MLCRMSGRHATVTLNPVKYVYMIRAIALECVYSGCTTEECVPPSCQIRMWLKRLIQICIQKPPSPYHNREQHFSCRGKPSHLFSYGRVRTMELRCQGVEGFWLHREGTMHDSYFKATRFGVDSKLCPREIDSFQTVISRGRGGRYVTVRCPCEYLHLFIELGW
jgi:hypothetical protein